MITHIEQKEKYSLLNSEIIYYEYNTRVEKRTPLYRKMDTTE